MIDAQTNFYLGLNMDLLLDAIEQSEYIDDVFYESDYMFDWSSSPGLDDGDEYMKLLQESWTCAFENSDYDWEMVVKPKQSVYKLKNQVRQFRNSYDYGKRLHPETGKCSCEIILLSLLCYKYDWTTENEFVANMCAYLRAQYQMWRNKKDSTARTTMLDKFGRYDRVLKKNLGENLID